MADKHDYEDEDYQFTDPDSFDNPPSEPDVYGSDNYYDDPLSAHPSEQGEHRLSDEYGMPQEEGKKNVIRNAIIAVLIIIFLMLAYAFIWPWFTKEAEITPVVSQPVVEPPKSVVSEPVVEPPPPQRPVATKVEEKLASLDLSQQNLRSELTALNNQMSTNSANINSLNAQITKQNEVLANVSSMLNEQAQVIAALNARLQEAKKPVAPVVIKERIVKKIHINYFLKAIVPGRAWLVASNGKTLTVREGSNVPGYGVVSLIDAEQGRVVLRSGRVIRFSPDDS